MNTILPYRPEFLQKNRQILLQDANNGQRKHKASKRQGAIIWSTESAENGLVLFFDINTSTDLTFHVICGESVHE